MKEYERRDQFLFTLGYKNYAEYLHSPLWYKIRSRAMKRGGRKCIVCKTEAAHVHHKSYDPAVLLGKDDSQLVCVCAVCHELAEYTTGGKKRTQKQANEWIDLHSKDAQPPSVAAKARSCRKKKNKKRSKKERRSQTHFIPAKCGKCLRNWARKNQTLCRPCAKSANRQDARQKLAKRRSNEELKDIMERANNHLRSISGL